MVQLRPPVSSRRVATHLPKRTDAAKVLADVLAEHSARPLLLGEHQPKGEDKAQVKQAKGALARVMDRMISQYAEPAANTPGKGKDEPGIDR